MNASPNPLKIAIVSDALYPYNIGGKEKRIYEISTRLARKGHQVTIYTMKWWKGKEMACVYEGVRHEAISPYYPLYAGERRSMKEALFFALHCFKLLGKKFDVIDVDHMPHLILFPIKIVCLLKRKRLIVTWNEVWGRKYWIKYLGLLGNIAYIVEYLASKLPDEIISISEHTTKKLKRELKVRQIVHTIPMGIDVEYINKIKPSKIKSDLLFSGRLLSHKNADYVIKAVAILKKEYPHIKCLIIGKGPEKGNLVQLVSKLNLKSNVIFMEFLEKHEDLIALMKSSKVFMFPSTREGFGIVALEAMASGLPVITVDHKDNASSELIMNGINGYLVKLREDELAKKYQALIDKPLLSVSESVEKYDWQYLSNGVERIYL